MFQVKFIGIALRHQNLTRETYARRGIKSGHPKVLRTLQTHDGCMQVELSRLCGITPATTVSLLNVMERDGLIERRAVPDDRRALGVHLTEKGRAQLDILDELDISLSHELLEGFTPEEARQFENYLERMRKNIARID